MADMEHKTALILGATGGIGGEVATSLVNAGWKVRAMHRDPQRVRGPARLDWVLGDAMVAADVARAAVGAALIVHAVNPPGYRDWDRLVLPMLDNTIAAAQANGARILLPGTLYNYAPELRDIAENAPQLPSTRKGRIRVEMERRLQAAAAAGAAKVLIVRAGDFFGPRAANNWFSQGLIKPGRKPRAVTYPGRQGVGHQWNYLPDVAETMVRLLCHEGLGAFARFHMEGHWDPDGTRMLGAIRAAAGDPSLSVRRMPWLAMRLAAPFVPLFRELAEMRYLWEQPLRLSNAHLLATIGTEPVTPLDEAVRATLVAMGCLGPEP
jgi:nucleoside-diphosphate-sugar epimerase